MNTSTMFHKSFAATETSATGSTVFRNTPRKCLKLRLRKPSPAAAAASIPEANNAKTRPVGLAIARQKPVSMALKIRVLPLPQTTSAAMKKAIAPSRESTAITVNAESFRASSIAIMTNEGTAAKALPTRGIFLCPQALMYDEITGINPAASARSMGMNVASSLSTLPKHVPR